MARKLCDQFANLSQVKVVRQRFNGWSPPRAGNSVTQGIAHVPAGVPDSCPIDVIAVAASTGGPAAVARLLQGLPAGSTPPILLVQHMADSFLEGYASWLGSVCGLEVTLAADNATPLPGRVYVAPGGAHLACRAGRLRLIPDEAGRGHVPSANVLFSSVAEDAGPRALGILLTGMGDDGALGLFDLRMAGAHTIVQDQATSVVYGMPAAARALGAAGEELPIGRIADRIAALTGAAPCLDTRPPATEARP
jgi:two-component system chemotaxis response regulator CheB